MPIQVTTAQPRQTISGVVTKLPQPQISGVISAKPPQTITGVVQANPQTLGSKPAMPVVPQPSQTPNINQRNLKGTQPVNAGINQQPAQPTELIKPGVLSIRKALDMGASPLQILAEISKQNIKKNRTLSESIRTALSAGAKPEAILDEIFKQNGALTQSQYKDYTAPQPEQQPGIAGLSREGFLDPNIVFGVGKGIAQAYGALGNLIAKPLDKAYEKITGQSPAIPASLTDEQLRPKNAAEGLGKFAGQVQQFALGAEATKPLVGAIEKTVSKTALPSLSKTLLNTFSRSLIGGGEAYGLSRLQGVNKEDSTTNALISGIIPWAATAFKALPIKNLGEKIQQVVIKPSKADLADGFKIENVNKYDLGGNLEETADKVQKAIKERVDTLKTKIKPGTADVDLNKVGLKVIEKFEKFSPESAGSNLAIQRELQKFLQETDGLSKSGIVDIADAQKIKQGFGAQGAWQWNIPYEDANAKEQIYNFAYNQLKTEIEKVGLPGIKQINKELSELIPIQNAVIRRIPIAARNSAISLTDLVALAHSGGGSWTLFALNRLAKSGKVGSVLSKLGRIPETRSGLGTIIFGAGTKDIKGEIPKLNVGLSIEDVSLRKAEEVGRQINMLNAKYVAKPTPTNKKALLQAKSVYYDLIKKSKKFLNQDANIGLSIKNTP